MIKIFTFPSDHALNALLGKTASGKSYWSNFG